MAKNPKNAEVYQKLIRSCKYFFVQNPIIVLERIFIRKQKSEFNNVIKCSDIDRLLSKLWVTEKFENSPKFMDPKIYRSLISSTIPKLYQVDAKECFIRDQILSFKEFLFLSSNVQHIVLNCTVVKNEDGSVVPLEKLVAVLPNVKIVEFYDSTPSSISKNTVQELLMLPHFSTINKFEFYNVPEIFDFVMFFDYMKTNKHTDFVFWLRDLISEDYKNRIEAIIDEILESQIYEFKIPLIRGAGIDDEKWIKLYVLWDRQMKNLLLSGNP
uniref:DUF38 domain-containing protein n=1 Tax=Panagrolaimus sp. ES5 TaxID=591445 RepID=A0AC34FSL2_9BILA